MRLLHTSDWHLGRMLYKKKRDDEFEAFLHWLLQFIQDQKIEILLIAGDIFDTTTPGNQVQEMYFEFLAKVRLTGCRHVVIIGGNHDSPTLLNAPKDLLKYLNIRVIGTKTENPEDEVILLKSPQGQTEAIICAVPFLRDRDVRTVEEGEQASDKGRKLIEGVKAHYQDVLNIACQIRGENKHIPVIGMGHLFTSNARTSDGDGVRELYVGTLAYIDGDIFSTGFDYMALGHLHLAQKAGGSETVRYPGAPLPMGFGEAGQKKRVIVVEFKGNHPVMTEHEIPVFRELQKISGSREHIISKIKELKATGSQAWLEVEFTDYTPAAEINTLLGELTQESGLEVIRSSSREITEKALNRKNQTETLESLTHSEVFERCIQTYNVADSDREILWNTYREAIAELETTDFNA